MNYMDKIDEIAKRMAIGLDHAALGVELHRIWKLFESGAAAEKYDILNRALVIENPHIHNYMVELLRLLYITPNANWAEDTAQLRDKDKEYGGSWCKRGGPGAFMMMARKWDRVEHAISSVSLKVALASDTREEGILDDLGDLRRYIILVLAWHAADAG